MTGAVRRAASLFLRVLAMPPLALLWLYQRFISPALGPACRYYPSCSQYAVEAVRMRGPFVGPFLAIRRLLRCHPWAEGGLDPVPPPHAPACGLRPSRAKPAPARRGTRIPS